MCDFVSANQPFYMQDYKFGDITKSLLRPSGGDLDTLPETNSSPLKIRIFPGKYHQNGGFSLAMLVYRSVQEFF